MTYASKLQYFTMAAWLRGYASGLDEQDDKALKEKLEQAADMLACVWNQSVDGENR